MTTGVPRFKMEIVQGATFRRAFYWYSGAEIVKPITAITRGYPTILTVPGHGFPDSEIPVAIIGGPAWLNTVSTDSSDKIYAANVDDDKCSIKVDSTLKPPYTAEAKLLYVPPVDLSAWTAAMQFRTSVGSSAILPILELTTENYGIVLGADGSINLFISDDDTALLTFTKAVAQLELTDPVSEDVTRLLSIDWTVTRESTR